MREKIEELVRQALADAQAAGKLPEFQIDDVGLERPQDSSNGDWSSTVAMRSAKLAHKAPRDIAAALVAHIAEDAQIERVEVAGPGFVNFYLSTAAGNEIFNTVREQGADFGRSSFGAGQKVQVEYVSANPVGPLHIGHGRWAALGDSLSRILAFAGYEVEREYYVNDHGSQMDVFGHSISKRYLQLIDIMQKRDIDADAAAQVLAEDRNAYVADEDDAHPEQHPFTDEFINSLGGNAYAGDYIVDLGLFFLKNDGEVWADKSEDERMAEFRERGYKMMLESIKNTCHTARSDFDVWFSERSLYVKDDQGKDAVDRALDALDKLGYLYRSDEGALFFRSTDFGDDKDRVLIKTNGEYTTGTSSSVSTTLLIFGEQITTAISSVFALLQQLLVTQLSLRFCLVSWLTCSETALPSECLSAKELVSTLTSFSLRLVLMQRATPLFQSLPTR